MHDIDDDHLWVNEIMSCMGYLPNAPNTQEGAEDRVFAHNEWFRNAAGAQGAYSAFIVYNPPGAHLSFNDSGDTANAYLGGPWTNMLYRNGGYDVADNAAIFAHETGHIFWAATNTATAVDFQIAVTAPRVPDHGLLS